MSTLQKKAKELIALYKRASELYGDESAHKEREAVIAQIKEIQANYGSPYFVRLVKSMSK